MPKKPCLLIEPYLNKNLAEIEAIVKSKQENLTREFSTMPQGGVDAKTLYEHAMDDQWCECIELAFDLGVRPNFRKGRNSYDIVQHASGWTNKDLACKVVTMALDRGYKYEISREPNEASFLTPFPIPIVERIIATSNKPQQLAQIIHRRIFSVDGAMAAMCEKHGASAKETLDAKSSWETIANDGTVEWFRRAMSLGIKPDSNFLINSIKRDQNEIVRIGISEYHLEMIGSDQYGNDVMDVAIVRNNVEVVSLLAGAGYKSKQCRVDTYGQSKGSNGDVFCIRHPEIAKIILESTCDHDVELRKRYAFVIGKYTDSAAIADVVVTSGGGVNATAVLSNLDFNTPNDAICVYLRKGNADPNVVHRESGKTVLMYSNETCRVALELGVTPKTLNAQDDKDGWTALMHAVHYHNPESRQADCEWVELLLNAHADVNIRDKRGRTALHVAFESCTYEKTRDCTVIKMLLDHGADVGARDNNGETPAFACARYYTLLALQTLVKYGLADVVSVRNHRGQTVLMHANTTEVINFLIDAGVDIDAQDKDGWTSLMHAGNKGDMEHLKVLVERGANVSLTAKDGRTLQQITQEAYDIDMSDFADRHSEDYKGNGCPQYLKTVIQK